MWCRGCAHAAPHRSAGALGCSRLLPREAPVVPPVHLLPGSRLKFHHFSGGEGAGEEREPRAGGGAQPLARAACAELGAHSKFSRTWLGWVSSADGAGIWAEPCRGGCRPGSCFPWAFPRRNTRLGRRPCQALGSCRCFLHGLYTPSGTTTPRLRGRRSRTSSSCRQKSKAEVAAGCASTQPAAAFPCLRTGSPKSPSSCEMEGLSHKTSNSLQPDCLASPSKGPPALEPVLG